MNLKRIGNALKKAVYKLIYWNNPVLYARKKGVTVGNNCNFTGHPNFGSEPYLVTIGNHVLISFDCSFITHDGAVYTAKGMTGRNDLWKYGKIKIGNNVSIGARSVIMPGVDIGDDSIIGACSLVTKGVPSGKVWGGGTSSFLNVYRGIC